MTTFNPPPNWPRPPAGWVPPEGWKPDPAWGDAPEGWPFWVDDATVVSDAQPPEPIPAVTQSPDGSAAPPEDATPLRPDIEGAIERMGRTLGIRRELRRLADKLDPGETVIELARVERAGHGCLLAVSNQRLLFLHEGMVRNSVEEVPIRTLTSVGSHRRLGSVALQVTVAGNADVWPMTSGTHSERVSNAIRQVMRQHVVAVSADPAPAPTEPAVPAYDPIEQLQKLGQLRDAGVLTEEEFAAKKATILDRM